MLVHKGGQINNVQLITGLRIAEMSQRQGEGGYVQRMKVIVRGGGSGRVGGGQGGCEWRSEACVKIQKKIFLGGGGRRGGRLGGGVQGGCEWRSEALVKIQKKKIWGGGGASSGWGGQGGLERRIDELKLL